MGAILDVPPSRSVYEKNCITEVENVVYGRDNRKPIHDAIHFTTDSAVRLHNWCANIGLTVQNGKLCVVYNG